MRRITLLKARDAEDEQLAEKSWRTKMKVLSRRSMAPGVLFLLCVVSLLFRMRILAFNWRSVMKGRQLRQHIKTQLRLHLADFAVAHPPWAGDHQRFCEILNGHVAPPERSNGYLLVPCKGSLNQQRGAICNAEQHESS